MLVYLDAVVTLNFIVDFLLILGTNRLTGFPSRIKESVLAASIGGMYAALCMIPGFHFLGNLLWRMVFLFLMSILAFGWNRSSLHRGSVFLLLTMALGGIASGIGKVDFFAICICTGLLWLLCRAGFPDQTGAREYIPVEICWQNRKVKLLALKDTGNMLRDPLTGEPVLVCGADVGEELLGIPRIYFQNPAEVVTSGMIPGLRLVPYHAIGQPGAMMPVLRMKQVKIGERIVDPLVAFAPQEIAKGEVYRMLTGGI